MSAPPRRAESAEEALAGLVERVTFHNPENGFCVLRVKARGQRELVTVVGHAPTINAGEWITATGRWVNDAQHGMQFKASYLAAAAPGSQEGILRYLSSGLIRGIGPVFAQKLVDAFGEAVFDVIETAPERLREVDGVGPVRARRIVDAWAEQKVVREIMIFLHSHGVGTARAVRIYKTYGTEALQVLQTNPYRLARDIRGIGFKTADTIAARLGIEPNAPIRVRAGIGYALSEAVGSGHCGLPEAELVAAAESLLEVPRASVESALAAELAEQEVVRAPLGEQTGVFLPGLYAAEKAVGEALRARASGEPPWSAIDAPAALTWVEGRLGVTLSDSQREAVREAVARKTLVITGGPGVGKTTLVRAILAIVATRGIRLHLAAPTGRAAKRLGEATGREAMTLHRLLEADPAGGGFKRHGDHPLESDLLVIDETSMVDVPLMHAVVKALPAEAALMLVGDGDQLPSVGPGQILADLIHASTVPVVRLTEVFRQAAASRIIQAAHRINAGAVPDLQAPEGPSDFYFVAAEDAETAVDRVRTLVGERIPRRFGLDPLREVQVLCPMNRGGVGARALNRVLQETLNGAATPRVERFGSVFAPGDKVMQLENDHDRGIYNGDLGFVEQVDEEAGELTVTFDGVAVPYPFGELDALVPAYATTIHKSQGSEFLAVVLPVLTTHYPMLQRQLVYTGVTRGKRLVVLVGQPKAIAIAVKAGGRRRWSKLRDWLEDAPDGG